MQLTKFKYLYIAVFTLFMLQQFTYASSPSEAKEGTEKAEKGNEVEADPKGVSEDLDFQNLLTRINTLESAINAKRADIKSLIKVKNSNNKAKRVKDENGKDITISTLHASFRELKELESNYQVKKKELKYRFPSQGKIIERRYIPVGAKSLEEMENELGIDGDLIRVKNKIVKKYKKFLPTEEVEKAAIIEKNKYDAKKKKARVILER